MLPAMYLNKRRIGDEIELGDLRFLDDWWPDPYIGREFEIRWGFVRNVGAPPKIWIMSYIPNPDEVTREIPCMWKYDDRIYRNDP